MSDQLQEKVEIPKEAVWVEFFSYNPSISGKAFDSEPDMDHPSARDRRYGIFVPLAQLEEVRAELKDTVGLLEVERKDPGSVARGEEFAAGMKAGAESAERRLEEARQKLDAVYEVGSIPDRDEVGAPTEIDGPALWRAVDALAAVLAASHSDSTEGGGSGAGNADARERAAVLGKDTGAASTSWSALIAAAEDALADYNRMGDYEAPVEMLERIVARVRGGDAHVDEQARSASVRRHVDEAASEGSGAASETFAKEVHEIVRRLHVRVADGDRDHGDVPIAEQVAEEAAAHSLRHVAGELSGALERLDGKQKAAPGTATTSVPEDDGERPSSCPDCGSGGPFLLKSPCSRDSRDPHPWHRPSWKPDCSSQDVEGDEEVRRWVLWRYTKPWGSRRWRVDLPPVDETVAIETVEVVPRGSLLTKEQVREKLLSDEAQTAAVDAALEWRYGSTNVPRQHRAMVDATIFAARPALVDAAFGDEEPSKGGGES